MQGDEGRGSVSYEREGVPEGKANIGGGATGQEPADEAIQETGGLLQGRTGETSEGSVPGTCTCIMRQGCSTTGEASCTL